MALLRADVADVTSRDRTVITRLVRQTWDGKRWRNPEEFRRCVCGVTFLPMHGRQLFHDPACSASDRMARFVKKRVRDYHAEYLKRRRGV